MRSAWTSLVVLGAMLALPVPAAARLRCAPGSFVVQLGPRLLPGLAGGYDVIRLGANGRRMTAAIGATCPPVRARTRGARVIATWPPGRCAAAGRVRLTMTIREECEVARGRVKRRGAPPVALVAPRCASDGVVRGDLGEQCAADAACGEDARCVDCRCVPIVRFTRDVEPIFTQCLTSACHEGGNAPGSFDLLPERAYPELLSKHARAGACAGEPLVAPGDPDASVLLKRVGGAECGASMPLGSDLLPAPAVDAIRAWIAQGASAD
jgi:hypothetical protein